jgi:hypothetical protein
MPTVNQVLKYKSSDPITTTPTACFPAIVAEQEYTDLRIKNDTGVDITISFGGNDYDALAEENIVQAFKCTGDVKLSAAAPTTGQFFIQLTHA